MKHRFSWLTVVVVDVAAVALAPIFDTHLHDFDVPFQIAYGMVAVVTFLCLLPVALDKNELRFKFRELIASSFIVTYLALVTSAAFFHRNLPEGNITATFVSNFTTLVGVVVGAYFTAGAVERFADSKKVKSSREENGKDDDQN